MNKFFIDTIFSTKKVCKLLLIPFFLTLFFNLTLSEARIGETPLFKQPNATSILGSPIVKHTSIPHEEEGYTVHVIETENKIILTEYATLDDGTPHAGEVFAVAWTHARFHPSYSQLIRQCNHKKFLDEENEKKTDKDSALEDPMHCQHQNYKQKRGNRSRNIKEFHQAGIVIETWGRMRNLSGRAYDPLFLKYLQGPLTQLKPNQIIGVIPDEYYDGL